MSVVPKRKRPLGKYALEARPKLFGGSIEEYVQATGQEIPAIITSCTRIINLYGLHHQGVFRVSGAQHEINEFKSQFERGEEPLLGKVDSRDINSVAGVLKLYFRELQEPLFPVQLFDELIACSKLDVNVPEQLRKCILRLQELLLPLPRPIVVVARYLFAFLNHLSEYSDENMMDPYNLAVCFGPTLLPVPADRDQVRYQNYVNELIRILICFQEKIFPNDGGPVYERCIVDDDADLEDSLDSLLEDAGPEGTGSEDDLDTSEREAVVLFDFNPRNSKELPLKKGDTVMLRTRISSDWWEGGTSSGLKGLIPHRFIALQLRPASDKPDSVVDSGPMRTSTESLPTTKTLSLVGNAVLTPVCDIEPLDRSVSQPNICGEVTLSVIVPASPTVLASCSSTSSDLSRGGYASADSLGSLSSKDELAAPSPIIEKDVKLPADTVADRNAVQSAGLTADEDLTDRCMSLSTSLEPTPDLVLNLPTASSVPITVRPLSPPLTTAEVFASAEHGTIKKNSGVDRNPNACGDSINCAFDEVFPTTPQEINDALDADSFSFDLLPPPPPRLLDHDDQELSLSVPVSHECEDQEPRDLMTANVTVDVDVVVVDDTAAAVVSSVAREELEHFENNDVVPAGSENSSSNSEQIDVIPVDANNDAESARLIHNDLELTVHVSSNDVALGIDMSASPVGSQSSALDAVVNAPVSPDRISASVAVSHTDEVLECPADHYTVNTEGGKTSNEMQYSIDSTSQQQVPDAASSQTIDAASFESRRSPQPPDDANVKMEPHVELVPCTEPSSSIGAESCSSQTACDSDLQAEKNVPLPVIPQVVPTSDCTTAVSQLVLNTHKLTHSVLAEHRAPPSLQAHSAVLDMLTKQHENSEELMKQPSSDKPKSKPPPVMKKPAKPAQSHDVTRQQ